MGATARLPALLAQARQDSTLFLPQVESHWLGMALGGLSAVVGVLASRSDWPFRDTVAWLALAGVMAGMVVHARWKRVDRGWRVDFAGRRVEPVAVPGGEVAVLQGLGWSVACAPGDRRAQIAIDLRHADRGRIARLFVSAARRRRDQQVLNDLADLIAQRLQIERSGPRL